MCGNFWSQGCHIKNKTGITCEGCEIRKNEPVSDESIAKHLRGEEQHIQYVLQKDGTIRFGAIDLDLKPGKEDKGYTWDDVKKLSNQLKEWGIAHSIARSTTMGFHVYMFFEEFYSADKFRSIMLEVFNRIGFMAYLQMQQKPLAEIFPKQGFVPEGGLGNGIKTPMIVSSYPKERNGWVTEDNQWIGAGLELAEMIDAQWVFFKSIPLVPSKLLDDLIEREEIQVFYDNPIANKGSKGASAYLEHYTSGRSGKWQPPLSGSIEKVLEGCAAFRRIRDKCLKGEVPGHDEGFTLYHLAMHTLDGLEWFEKHVPGWGKTTAEKKQLEYSIKKDYAPSTCKTMQNNGLCIAGTQCFKKKPPVETVEGKTVVRDDIPESKWAEPSPIRYAFGKGEDFLKKLQEEALEAAKIKEKDERFKVFYDLAMRSQVFDADQIKEFKQFLKDSKLLKVSEISKLFAEASDKAEEGMKKKVNDRDDTVQVDDNQYQKLKPYGYSLLKPVKGNKFREIRLCSIDVVIEEVKTYLDEDRQVDAVFKGKLVGEGFEGKFEIPVEKWAEDSELLKLFTVVATNHCTVMRANVPFIRQAAIAFSNQHGIKNTSHLTTQGWYRKKYVMPSVIIDEDGIRENFEFPIDLSGKTHSRNFDFALIGILDLKEVLFHLKNEYLDAWPRMMTTMVLSHCIFPIVSRWLKPNSNTTLFLEGLTGIGKTELLIVTQKFWGPFQNGLLNFMGTLKGIADVAHDCKNVWLVIDDYKQLNESQKNIVVTLIQHAYDQQSAVKLNQFSKQIEPKSIRATLAITGELFPDGEASVAARALILQGVKFDTSLTKEKYDRVMQFCDRYRGVFPHLIHWILNQDTDSFKVEASEVQSRLIVPFAGMQNAPRITSNLANLHVCWSLWIKFNVLHGICSQREAEELMSEHYDNLVTLGQRIVGICDDEQVSSLFVSQLKQVIITGNVAIRDFPGQKPSKSAFCIGIYKDLSEGPSVCIHPQLALSFLRKFYGDMAVRGNVSSIAKLLKEEGFLLAVTETRNYKSVRDGDQTRRMWQFAPSTLGLECPDNLPTKKGVQNNPQDELFTSH